MKSRRRRWIEGPALRMQEIARPLEIVLSKEEDTPGGAASFIVVLPVEEVLRVVVAALQIQYLFIVVVVVVAVVGSVCCSSRVRPPLLHLLFLFSMSPSVVSRLYRALVLVAVRSVQSYPRASERLDKPTCEVCARLCLLASAPAREFHTARGGRRSFKRVELRPNRGNFAPITWKSHSRECKLGNLCKIDPPVLI